MKKALRKAADYQKIVEWSDEDSCDIGSAPPLIGLCYHGNNEVEVVKELSRIVTEWIEILEKEGKPLPKASIDKE